MKQLSMRSKNSLTGLLFISPWILGFLLFTAYPLFYSLYLSFQKVRITTEGIQTTFVKFDNFKDAFTVDALFTQKLLTFVQELVLSVPIIIVFSLIIAILLNQPIRFRNFFRMIFFLPVIIASGPVINELISQGVTSIPSIKDYAVFETMLSADSLFSSVLLYLMDNLIIILWFSGVQFLIFLAALQKIDTQVYEAAKIDGASNWECFWKVTLPSIFPMIVVNTVYTIVTFSIFSLNPVIEHIQTNMFQINTGFGYASALSWIYFLLIAVALGISVALLTVRGRKNYA
ncbi:ABC transporter permease [Sutcliffiella horikoshii]|uniref:ABC transporter permease n=1 Tax=Sutcliffiella horikoshii TaxID=79883 RepID=A0A1Y0CRR6_9BACI|nr:MULTISPECIES: sugar ABC transporter permease [Bacillaceae]ART77949.1 ABC transporter permease [Sutcliffiella horikoshii]TYS60113.1 sugar ABC transporter permease [Sutcliffiella horikoshii]TYS72259.1 sugar ABC transporter permease [Sutcliffiella horikoshii]